jgi:serine/threonine-protein kinase PRP4
MELDLPPSPPPVEDVLAARRAKRLAILAKYNGVESVGASPSPSSAVQPPPSSSSISDAISHAHSVTGTPIPSGVDSTQAVDDAPSKFPLLPLFPINMYPFVGKRESMSASPTPADFTLAKDDDEEKAQAKVQAENTDAEQISAADYDPSLDRREDEQRRVREPVAEIHSVEEEEEVEEEDDVDDMFAVATSDTKKVKKKVTVSVNTFQTYLSSISIFPIENCCPRTNYHHFGFSC